MMKIKIKSFSFFLTLMLILSITTSCGKGPFKGNTKDMRDTPITASERAKKNIKEGRGVTLKTLGSNRGTNYEFSTSNPMWRASLEVLDFLPLSTVDYSGGIIITDWYSDNINANESLKITVRFLSNEIQANSMKIIIHKKNCDKANSNCSTKAIKSKIEEQLRASILKIASQYKKNNKK